MNAENKQPAAADQDDVRDDQARLQTEIQERVRAEQALRASEERFRSLIENAQDMICVFDAQAIVLYKSPSVERILGYTPEELVGTNAFDMIHPDDAAQTKEFLERVLRQPGVALTFGLRLRHKEGGWHSIEAIFDNHLNHPAIRGVVVNYRDLTERKAVEQQLAHAQKMESIGRLAGGIAHDFNNLLAAILGYAELATEEVPAESLPFSYLHHITEAAQRAARLTRQLLTFARRQPAETRVVHLDDLVVGLKSLLQRLLGEDVELVTLPNAPGAFCRVDPGQIEQVLVNLAVNARDAMADGGRLTIETAEVQLDDASLTPGQPVTPGPYLLLLVRDNGAGMTPQVRARIFDPFFTTKEVGRGTGLGLSTCYGIVKQCGGYILVDSAPNQGTVFSVYLPLVAQGTAESTDGEIPMSMRQNTETVLLVEDEPLVCGPSVQALRAQGYTVLEASNGEEACQMVHMHAQPIQLLITDVIMPQMGGRELSDRLRAMDPELKVLFISGYLDDTNVRHGVLEPDRHFLAKPFTPAELAAKVRAVLDA